MTIPAGTTAGTYNVLAYADDQGVVAEGSEGNNQATKAIQVTAGALPDFWFALIMIFLFFFQLGWAPGPIGQLDLTVSIPPRVTGMYAVDALLAGDWPAFRVLSLALQMSAATR